MLLKNYGNYIKLGEQHSELDETSETKAKYKATTKAGKVAEYLKKND